MNDPDIEVMKNPKATTAALMKGIQSKNPMVRRAVMRNHNATAEIISKGLTDQYAVVRAAAFKSPKVTCTTAQRH